MTGGATADTTAGTDGRAAAARPTVASILRGPLGHEPGDAALILFDRDSTLSAVLAQAYSEALPGAARIEVPAAARKAVLDAVSSLSRGALVVLVESSRFALAAHRFRVELFALGLKVVEHPHLGRIRDDEIPAYLDSLAYDAAYYRTLGPALKARIDRASSARLVGTSGELAYGGPLEPGKLNVGDYSGHENVGGQFPIGEVFTEARDLTSVSGSVELFGYGAADFSVAVPATPIRLKIEAGRVAAAENAPEDFRAILEEIRAFEEEVWLRELGFGLNRAFTRERRVSDVGAYERMCGIHLSLGAKHAIYPKAGFSKRRTKYHVDVFAAVERAEIDGIIVYKNGQYKV